MLGLPALIAISIAIIFIVFTQVGREKRLESWYNGLLESARQEFQTKTETLSAKKILVSSITDEEQAKLADEEISELEQTLDDIQEQEQVFLAKLIDLRPENLEYTFQLAMAYQGKDEARQQALLANMAPEDEPVFFRAHLYMAEFYLLKAQQATTYGDQKFYLDKALVQADHCLTQQGNYTRAMEIKAAIHQRLDQFAEAAELLSKLFAKDARYYRSLTAMNEKLGRDNTFVLETAVKKFIDIQNKNTEDDTKIWVNCWDSMVWCWVKLRNYKVAIDNLEHELGRQQDNAVRQKFLRTQLSAVYTAWAASEKVVETDVDSDARRRSFDRLVSAYDYDSRNPATLKLISWFVANDDNLSSQAKQVYDPYEDPDPPSDVLSELGIRALQVKDFERAIKLFQRARDKEARNPALLNNLAFALLASQNTRSSAEEALSLVEEGLRILASNKDPLKQATFLLDTRGEALMQLNRKEDAIASFEQALQRRPENQKIIEKLILCYDGRIDQQAGVYREYLKELRENETTQNTSTE